MSYFQLVVNSYTVGKTSSWRWWKKKLINLSISFFCDQSETIYWLMESVKKQCQLPMLPGDCLLRKCQHRFLGQWSIETSLKDKGFPNLCIVEAVSDPIKTCANNKYCKTRAGLEDERTTIFLYWSLSIIYSARKAVDAFWMNNVIKNAK